MAKGDWQVFIPGWNVYYMIREWKRREEELKKLEETAREDSRKRNEEFAKLMIESKAVLAKIDALKAQMYKAIFAGNQAKASEIIIEINKIAQEHTEKLNEFQKKYLGNK